MRIKFTLAAAAIALAVATGALAQNPWKVVNTIGQRRFVVVEPAAARNTQVLRRAAASTCTPGKPCVVSFWSNPSAVPRTMLMTRPQQQAVVAQYLHNPVTGKEELLLRCAPTDASGAKCLH
jgi:hypothetical protein